MAYQKLKFNLINLNAEVTLPQSFPTCYEPTTVKQFFCHCKRCIPDVVINLGKEVSIDRLVPFSICQI